MTPPNIFFFSRQFSLSLSLSLSLSSNFWQLHCHNFFSSHFSNSIATFFFLPFRQQHCHKSATTIFFSSHFGNSIATNQLSQFFFPSIFGLNLFFSPSFPATSLPQFSLFFFSSHFQQLGCHNSYFLSSHSPRILAT